MLNKEKVVLVRLTSGEELIGERVDEQGVPLLLAETGVKFEERHEGPVTLKNPHIIVPQQAEGGQIRIAMAPWVFYFRGKDHVVPIRAEAIVFCIPAEERLVLQLQQMVSPIDLSATKAAQAPGPSGLILPTSR